MTFQLILRSSSPPSASPYRLLDGQGRELAWANAFLDAQRLRQLSLRSLRAYGYDLLHLARWLHLKRHRLAKIDQSILLDYVRYQLDQLPKPAPSTVNHRLAVLGKIANACAKMPISADSAHLRFKALRNCGLLAEFFL